MTKSNPTFWQAHEIHLEFPKPARSFRLHVSERRRIETPHPEFQLFMTKGETDLKVPISCPTLTLKPYTADELAKICEMKYPKLSSPVKMLAPLMVAFNQQPITNHGRRLTVRDLLLLCQMCTVRNQKLTRESLFEESVSVFCRHLKDMADRRLRAEMLRRLFQVDAELSKAVIENHVARQHVQLGCGRIELLAEDATSSFCITGQVATLLEFLGHAITLKRPVLLVGDTGVGKTSAVQFLARKMSKELHVLNVCDNSESSDLFGSFKPVDVSIQCRLLLSNFASLRSQTYSQSKNAKFSKFLHDAVQAKR